MEEFSQSISHPNIKQASYVIPDSGTFLISQSSRDHKATHSNANIKNLHLRKYIESREREKRAGQPDAHKASG